MLTVLLILGVRKLNNLIIAVFTGLILVSAPLSATVFEFQASGHVKSITTLDTTVYDNGYTVIPTPAGVISQSDAYSIYMLFDTADASVTGLYEADPSINIYNLRPISFRIEIGSYVSDVTYPATFGSLQLWDGYAVPNVAPNTDAFSLNFSSYLPVSVAPFALGEGQVFQNFQFGAFDWTGHARTSDDIADQPPLSAYSSSQTAAFVLLNPSQSLSTVVQLSVTTATIAAAPIPEPSTWAMLIVGFSAIGYGMRRKNSLIVSYS